jgi:alkaline phosphatase
MPGKTNAAGTLEALARADAAAGVILDFVNSRSDTLMLQTADSDASGVQVYTDDDGIDDGFVKFTTSEGGLLKGRQGTLGEVFLSAPNSEGKRLPFAIAFTGGSDVAGGILVRAAGFNSELVRPLMDNTEMYSLMYRTLFGRVPVASSH